MSISLKEEHDTAIRHFYRDAVLVGPDGQPLKRRSKKAELPAPPEKQ
jgi:UDP-N-acetyl-D-mannosaminuronic acid transferase (WecB/TagA/CpsF family)